MTDMRMIQDTQITLSPIGRVRTGFDTLESCPATGRSNPATSIIEIAPDFAEGLVNIELATHAIVLYWLDRSDRTALQRHARQGEVTRGVFASRSPNRPNPVALSVVRIEGRESNQLRVSGLDCLDGTAVIDIKPYVPEDDCVPEARIGWDSRCKTPTPKTSTSLNPEACRC